MTPTRCAWAETADATMQAYHDTEWGVPHHDDRALFELMTLEGAQAGLSWRTVLAPARGVPRGLPRLRHRPRRRHDRRGTGGAAGRLGVIRHRLKIWSVRDNARAALAAIERHGSLDRLSVVLRRRHSRSSTAGTDRTAGAGDHRRSPTP